MAEYSSLKVPELKKLLAEKKLPQTGNKADLIARLLEDDRKRAHVSSKQRPAAGAGKERIGRRDGGGSKIVGDAVAAAAVAPESPPPKASSEAATPAAATPSAAQLGQNDGRSDEGQLPAADAVQPFSMGLTATPAKEEARKRADRAMRFGVDDATEAARRADRAKRFGIDESALASGLDSALPERPVKRGRDGDFLAHRPGKKHGFHKQRSGHGYYAREPRSTGRFGSAPRGPAADEAAERAKAARAARFATAH